ncbi:P450-derived glycosyltransferase activator [Streptantibioticus rubrisoli]|uniref:P450-derived glycosyltransferase activator n=1 Tax=Streptantibioticus rubrisoli TaxID=1387313 RepID=A0ABT1PF27_9ACTN|nr:P450-derived glycosyltransferase activator [Streptantibioticus rubrisoli]MCQ4043396.1 P450-derived glycosyltransferase activator [Streptantibioticus rubrisoli]
MSNLTDSELGGMMQLVRGTQWYVGMFGDPYALLLRAQADDPYPHYELAREQGRLYQSPLGSWVCTGHALAAQVLADPRFDARTADGGTAAQHVLALDDSFLGLDRTAHDRLRERTATLLGPQAVERYRTLTERVGGALLDGLGAEFDLAADFATPLAVGVLAELLAVPTKDRARFAEHCPALGTALDAEVCPQQLAPARALITALRWLRGELAARPDTGLLDEVAAAGGDEAADDALAVAVLLAVTGIPATSSLVCNAALALLADPARCEEVRSDPGLLSKVIDETLRHDPPVHLRSLVAREDVRIDGQLIAAGSQLVVLLAAANRDPEVFCDPGRFDPHRAESAALLGGAHHELTAPLARLQAEVALRLLLDRLPRLRQDGPIVRRRRAPVSRAIARVPVTAA